MKKTTLLKTLLVAIIFALTSVNANATYSGTGTFTKISTITDLTDGYYVIAYGTTFAMSNTNTGTYFGNTAITPTSNSITDPSTAIVWEIKNHTDGGKTIYNEASAKYASYTGTSNAAYAVASVTGGSERWTFAYTSSLFTITNITSSTRLLQFNTSSPRFACYTGSQQNITLYKLQIAATAPVVTPASPTGTVGTAFSFNISATNTPTSYNLISGTLPAGLSLNTASGAITGTPTTAGPSSVTVTATNSIGTSTPATISFNIAKANQTITFGALDTKTNLDAAFDLTATASSGLAVAYASSNTSVATIAGSTVTIVGVGTTTITASQGGNDNYNGATSVNQDLSVIQYATPTITITEITVPSFTASLGNTSSQNVNISGVNLTGDITLALSGANADQFSLSQTALTQSGGTAPNTAITINYTPTATGTHTATLTLSSAGAISVTRTLSGACALEAPVATAATNVSASGFTANWNALSGATEYQLAVYSKSNSLPTIINEGFDAAPTAPTNWTFTTIATTYTSAGNFGTSSPSIKFDASGDAVTSPILPSAATEMSFWLKGQTSTGSSLLVEGFNGTAWVTIENITTLLNTTKTYLYSSTTSPTLPTGITQFRYTYTKVTSNLAFDDVSYTYGSAGTTALTGSPFTVTGTASKTFTGLTGGTNYYYSVTAKVGTQTTASSNEIQVNTLSTGLKNTYDLLNINASNGSIKFNAEAGETIEIFNAIGQKVITQKTIDGINTIQINTHGVLLVKVGNRLGKVIL